MLSETANFELPLLS